MGNYWHVVGRPIDGDDQNYLLIYSGVATYNCFDE
jgi:hypothetical protein